MRLLRMTTRRWMVVVAVTALCLWIADGPRRSRLYRARAAMLGNEEIVAIAKLSIKAHPGSGCVVPYMDPETADLPAALEPDRQRALYWRRLKLKYEAAAKNPWIPLAPALW
jgi:hypothetical protein